MVPYTGVFANTPPSPSPCTDRTKLPPPLSSGCIGLRKGRRARGVLLSACASDRSARQQRIVAWGALTDNGHARQQTPRLTKLHAPSLASTDRGAVWVHVEACYTWVEKGRGTRAIGKATTRFLPNDDGYHDRSPTNASSTQRRGHQRLLAACAILLIPVLAPGLNLVACRQQERG